MEKPFKIWEPSQLSPQLQAVLAKDQSVTVYRVIWEPNGQLFGECKEKKKSHNRPVGGTGSTGIAFLTSPARRCHGSRSLCAVCCRDGAAAMCAGIDCSKPLVQWHTY